MDVWWNNHFLCNDLESSNSNNHKKLDVWSSRQPNVGETPQQKQESERAFLADFPGIWPNEIISPT